MKTYLRLANPVVAVVCGTALFPLGRIVLVLAERRERDDADGTPGAQ